jgi:hypothetical protein
MPPFPLKKIKYMEVFRMKNIFCKVMTIGAATAALAATVIIGVKVKAARAKAVLAENKAEGFVDTAVKILMAVVIGALVLGGLYLLFSGTILPELTKRIQEMFNYKG